MEQQTDRLAEIQEREKRATSDWRVEEERPGKPFERRVYDRQSLGVCKPTSGSVARDAPNIDFIVHAREDVPYLVAEVQSLRAERDALKAKLGTWEDCSAQAEAVDRAHKCALKVEAERDTLREALERAHRWLEMVDAMRGMYFGLDHKIGENVDGCSFCAALASPQTAEETKGRSEADCG
jgi:hypothetical protein